MKAVLIFIAILAAPAWSGTTFQAATRPSTSNAIEGYLCEPILVQGREIAWAFVGTRNPTEIGLVAQICKEETLSRVGATPDGSRYGALQDGWFVVDLTKGTLRPLSLPQLGEFSKPSFCNTYVAYWRTQDPANYSLVVADLRKEMIIKTVSFGALRLSADHLHLLSPAIWSSNCTVATFGDDVYVKLTSINVSGDYFVPPSASAIAQWIVEENGMGPLKVGLSIRAVGELLGRPLAIPAGTAQTGCVSVKDGQVEGLSYLFTNGRLARIEVDSPTIHTNYGAAVGDTIERIRKLYWGLDERPNLHRGAPDLYLTFWTVDRRFALRFETENGKVSKFYAGRAPEVEFVDGCQ